MADESNRENLKSLENNKEPAMSECENEQKKEANDEDSAADIKHLTQDTAPSSFDPGGGDLHLPSESDTPHSGPTSSVGDPCIIVSMSGSPKMYKKNEDFSKNKDHEEKAAGPKTSGSSQSDVDFSDKSTPTIVTSENRNSEFSEEKNVADKSIDQSNSEDSETPVVIEFPSKQPEVIENGLLLRSCNNSSVLGSVSYSWAPICTPRTFDWTLFSAEHVDKPYIHYLFMTTEVHLPTEVAKLNSTGQAKALVVINSQEAPVPDTSIFFSQETRPEVDTWVLPVLFVGSDIGVLLENLQSPADVKVKFKDADEARQEYISVAAAKWPDLSTWINADKATLKPRELTSMIIKFLLDVEREGKSVSSVQCQFVMRACYYFEQNSSPQEAENALKFLSDYVRNIDRFISDFPLLMLLAYRTRIQWSGKYKCSYRNTYTEKCMYNLEKVMEDVKESLVFDANCSIPLLETMEAFLKESFTFDLDFNKKNTVSAFVFFRKSLEKLYKDYGKGKEKCTPFRSLFWVSLIMKSVKAEESLDTVHKVNESSNTIGWNAAIKEITPWLASREDMKCFKIILARLGLLQPAESPYSTCQWAFGVAELKSLSLPTSAYSRLSTVRHALSEFRQIFSNLDHLLKYLKAVNDNYDQILSKLKGFTQVTNRFDAISEGLMFANVVFTIITEENWFQESIEPNSCCKWFTNWIDTICRVLDFKDQIQLKDCLQELFAYEQYPVLNCGFLKEYIEKKVCSMTKAQLQFLNVHQFTTLYESLEIWPKQLVYDYLKVLLSEKGAHIFLDEPLKKFFCGVAKKIRGASRQQFLTEVLIQIGNEPGHVALNHLINLLQFSVPHLLEVLHGQAQETEDIKAVEAFEKKIRTFIAKNCPQDCLWQGMNSMTKAMAQCKSEHRLQTCLIDVIVDAMIPQTTHLAFDNSLEKALIFAQQILSADGRASCLSKVLSEQDRFLMMVITKVCECCSIPEILRADRSQIATLQNISTLTLLFKNLARKHHLEKPYFEHLLKYFRIDEYNQYAVQYLSWIGRVQHYFKQLKHMYDHGSWNYEEVINYQRQDVKYSLKALAEGVCVAELVLSEKQIKSYAKDFQEQLESLDSILIKKVQSDAAIGDSWCTLISLLGVYGVQLDPPLQVRIMNKVSFPTEIGPKDRVTWDKPESELQVVPRPESSKSLPCSGVYLRVCKSVALYMLKELHIDLNKYLQPISPYLDALVQFQFHPSRLFVSYKHYVSQISTTNVEFSIEHLSHILSKTKNLFLKVLDETATYEEITANGNVDISSLQVDVELENLLYFVGKETKQLDGLIALECFLKLFQFPKTLSCILSVCETFGLINCKGDSKVSTLQQICDEFATDDQKCRLTTTKAKQLWKKVEECLDCISLKDLRKVQVLFEKANQNVDFFRFLKDHGYLDDNGEQYFREQIHLITAQLQQEEYDDMVINHLLAAYNYFSVFADSNQSFAVLLESVAALDIATDSELIQINTVKNNMHLIQFWFSKAGDTLENVAHQLESIMISGVYYIEIGPQSCLELKFTSKVAKPQPVSTTVTSESNFASVCHTVVELSWKEDKIQDFVQRLGFHEGGKRGTIEKFNSCNEAAHILFGLYLQLRELGHKDYCSKRQELTCSGTQWEVLIRETKETISKWNTTVQDLQREYKLLLYFSIPKLLLLYNELRRAQLSGSCELMCSQVDVLFPNVSSLNVMNAVNSASKSPGEEPMEVVGSFLNKLSQLYGRSSSCNESDYPFRLSSPVHVQRIQHKLHFAPGFSQEDLILLVLKISSQPLPYTIFHCHSSTTEQDLKRFTERIIQHPSNCYVMLETNKLPFHLQETLVQLYLDVKQCKDSSVHFIETSRTALQEIPWLIVSKETRKSSTDKREVQDRFKHRNMRRTLSVEIVHGLPGDGKSHYIRKQVSKQRMPDRNVVYIAVNESFSYLKAIEKLCSLPYVVGHKQKCAVVFNFTIHLNMSDSLMSSIGWFFFHLLVLGYIEDQATGKSFHIPDKKHLLIFIEVPSGTSSFGPGNEIEQSLSDLELFLDQVSVLRLFGENISIDDKIPYDVDDNVQLVCKYLNAYKNGTINKLYKSEFRRTKPSSSKVRVDIVVKFSTDKNLSDEECQQLLDKFIPQQMKRKVLQKLFIQYMQRRCKFLDCLPGYNYNQGVVRYMDTATGEEKVFDTQKLGSTLMEAMLKEASNFNTLTWTDQYHIQLVYLFHDGGGSFHLISRHPDRISQDIRHTYRQIGATIPSTGKLHSAACLHAYISDALSIPLEDNGRLKTIVDSSYVLTLDYTLKLLNIHERYESGVPIIIEGETGVGKTAIVEILSKLWNEAWQKQWELAKSRIFDLISARISSLTDNSTDHIERQRCINAIQALNTDEQMEQSELEFALRCIDRDAGLCDDGSRVFLESLKYALYSLKDNPILSVIEFKTDLSHAYLDVEKSTNKLQSLAQLLKLIFKSKLRNLFFKKCIHSALTLEELEEFFNPIFQQAKDLLTTYSTFSTKKREQFSLREPFIVIYLDEINTSSCGGLLKEIITDKSIDGKPIPENIFIVASCNPHRDDSLATHVEDNSWLKTTYYVQKLHPTLQYLICDYGALDEEQERQYITAKLELLNEKMKKDVENCPELTELILKSQQKMREYATEHLMTKMHSGKETAITHAKSTVSQRDIQRVFTFYCWLLKLYSKPERGVHCANNQQRRAVMVALGLVYYMRLNENYRKLYKDYIDKEMMSSAQDISFKDAFDEELNWFITNINPPASIAKTTALKENVFAIIACSVTRTPLIIVGDPGSSKTLSFNLVVSKLKGKEIDENSVFQHADLFQALDPHFYQCSRRTTSNEVKKVFTRAINRQKTFTGISLNITCVVFMDEAGLPEEQLESLKVLHQYLDQPNVSFVAISNDILDAAKTNRALSLFRPKASDHELTELAKCAITTKQRPLNQVEEQLVQALCNSYKCTLSTMPQMFGLRDFMYFITYLRRHHKTKGMTAQLVLQSLERNFSGTERFSEICDHFFDNIAAIRKHNKDIPHELLQHRNILEVLTDSLKDSTFNPDGTYNEVRYKLIIDSSSDDSLVRMLFKYGVLEKEKTKMYVCSDFPADSHMKVNVISQIRHSAAAGHTVVMCQTDDIHESFYDLFNIRFRTIRDPKHGMHFYTNMAIGAHSKPCRVNPNFQCLVVVRKSDLKHTPAPFLNRFEKYFLSHKILLKNMVENHPPCMQRVLTAAYNKAAEFIKLTCNEKGSLYGKTEETLDSLMLTILPRSDHKIQQVQPQYNTKREGADIGLVMLHILVTSLRVNHGFCIPEFAEDDLVEDAKSIFELVCRSKTLMTQLQSLKPETVEAVVDEGFEILYSSQSPDPKSILVVYRDSCLVIAVLLQWLIGYLIKCLLNLMTPEALMTHSGMLPRKYITHYLQTQCHFSIKDLLENTVTEVQQTSSDIATKLLCYTRSSQLIRCLPPEFPFNVVTNDALSDLFLEKHIFGDLNSLSMYKVSSQSTQNKIEKILDNFVTSSKLVLVFIANSADVTLKMINHLRIMIEIFETRQKNSRKTFVLLLHFPAVDFYNNCYSSVYLNGWEHHYLDTITHGAIHATRNLREIRTIVDIQQWYRCCCATETILAPHVEDNGGVRGIVHTEQSTEMNIDALIKDSLPIIESRVGKFTPEELHDLLVENDFGNILATKYIKYWDTKAKLMELRKLTEHTCKHKSTLNVTNSLQINIRSYFINFAVYMINLLSDELITFLEHRDQYPITIFYNLLEVIPVPRLSQLRDFNVVNLRLQFKMPKRLQNHKRLIRFPLSKHISKYIEDLIDECREFVNKDDVECNQSKMPEQSFLLSQAKKPLYNQYCQAVQEKMDSCPSEERVLFIQQAATEMNTAKDHWKRYLSDFIQFKLGFYQHHPRQDIDELLLQQLLVAYLQPIHDIDENDCLTRLISLHILFKVNQIDLERLAKVLSLLSTIRSFDESMDTTSLLESAVHFGPFLTLSKTVVCDITSVVCNTLYDWFRNSLKSDSATYLDPYQFLKWYKCYQTIIFEPLAEELLLNTINECLHAKLTILHTTYLMQCSCKEDTDCSIAVDTFKQLDRTCVVQSVSFDKFPHLEVVSKIGLQLLFESSQETFETAVQDFMQGLFEFFFSERHKNYNPKDKKWFLSIANQQIAFSSQSLREIAGPLKLSSSGFNHDSMSCIGSLCMFKCYLLRLLDIHQSPSTLFKFNPEVQVLIDETLQGNSDSESVPENQYIPTFYPTESDSVEIQERELSQPLAHLYFHCVLEYLLDLYSIDHKKDTLPRMVFIKLINFLSATNEAKQPHLKIQRQATVQALIRLISVHFDPLHPERLSTIFIGRSSHGINEILCDSTMGGHSEKESGHGLVLAMHLHTQLNSATHLIQTLSDDTSTLITDVHCMKPLQELSSSKATDSAHKILPFIGSLESSTDEESSACIILYQRIYTILVGKELSSQSDEEYYDAAVDELKQLTLECCQSSETIDLFGKQISMKHAFQVLLWLCIYHEFYCQKKQSSTLAEAIGTKLNGILESPICALYQSFIDRRRMIQCGEVIPDLDENAQRFFLSEDLRFMPLHKEGLKFDPAVDFFNPTTTSKDPLDVSNCHGVANLVAAVLACPPRSNHLWYLMFAADELEEKYMTGFLYNDTIKAGRLYDCGIELTPDGQYGRPDYLPHATRGTLSLHSLYHLLWSNFAALCIGLVTQPDAQKNIHGKIISKMQSVRHYCTLQLRAMWLHMTTNMNMNLEEHTFFITRSMSNVIKYFCQPHTENFGQLETEEQLNHYENQWHNSVFLPSLRELPQELAKHCNYSHDVLIQKLRDLSRVYPRFPTLSDFTQRMLSSVDISKKFPLLTKFLIAYSRLQAGGAVLPELISFYKWIHTVLPYTCPMSLEYARGSTFEKIITDRKLVILHSKVKDGFNRYLQTVGWSVGLGGCSETKRDGKLEPISDDTKILYFISETEDAGQSNDVLYLIISDIVNFHNAFLEDAIETAKASGLKHYFPEQEECHFINPAEIHQKACIISTSEDFTGQKQTERHLLDLVRRRYLYPNETQQFAESMLEIENQFDLEHLQEDICRSFLVGKPLIHNIEEFRTQFKFTASKTKALELGIPNEDLDILNKYLDECLKLPLEAEQIQEFEYGFHSAECQLLVDVAAGLYRIAKQLVEVTNNPDHKQSEIQVSLTEFCSKHTSDQQTSTAGFGVFYERLNQAQKTCLKNLQVPFLFSILKLCLDWINDGMYDFSHLPHGMKKDLPIDCKETLCSAHLLHVYEGDIAGLLSDIDSFVKVLIHCETYMTQNISQCAQRSIVEFLRDPTLYLLTDDDDNGLIGMMMSSVHCHHYVKLRVHLRKIEQELASQQELIQSDSTPKEKWDELVHDLWEDEKYLKYLWEAAVDYEDTDTFIYDPSTGTYGFQNWDSDSDEDCFLRPPEPEQPVPEEPIPPIDPIDDTPQVTQALILKVAKTISISEVGEFLVKNKLVKYKKVFEDEEIDGDLLISLTDEELKDIGIINSFHRTKIRKKFREFCEEKLTDN